MRAVPIRCQPAIGIGGSDDRIDRAGRVEHLRRPRDGVVEHLAAVVAQLGS